MANLKYKKDDSWISISAVRGPKGDNADITLNGQTSQNVSLYAPIEGGSIGQYLSASGDGKAPKWKDLVLPIVGNGTLTIQKNGTSVGTFSANANSNQNINIEVPTNQNIIDLIYPIGSIYINANAINPEILFGGEWEQIKDMYLVAAGDQHNVGSNYGSNTKNLSHTHTAPAHTHSYGFKTRGWYGTLIEDFAILDAGNTWKAPTCTSNSSTIATRAEKTTASSAAQDMIVTANVATAGNAATTSSLSSTFDVRPSSIAVHVWKRIG